jgi:pectate lyase
VLSLTRHSRTLVIFLILLLDPALMYAQQPAFPTAEGSGAYARGGRGGKVYEVTTLTNSGPGSLVDAMSQGNRTIVFRISGTIDLGGIILKPKSFTTIAGQTAPGDGICLKGRIQIGAVRDVVIRYIRVRVDAGAANSSGDAIDIDEGKNIIIDHVTASYARDEGISCQETSDSVTVQWCIISEALTFEGHSYGSLIRGDSGDVKTYHHNLYAHNSNRMPRPGNYSAASADTEGLHFDFRNNVVYNWNGNEPGYNSDTNNVSRYNLIGNVFLPGSESSVRNTAFKESCKNAYGYFADNSYNGVVPADQWSLVVFNGFTAGQVNAYKARSYVVPMAPVNTTSPAQAKEDVLASAGASLPVRDTIDRRIVNDVRHITGHSILTTASQPEGAWPTLNSLPAPPDDDHDGMPNSWEIAHGSNPADSTDGNLYDPYGYTKLETYLNALTGYLPMGVHDPGVTAPETFSLEQNYPNPFNPLTTIQYTLAGTRGLGLGTRVIVYDVLGREVAVLVNEVKSPGRYSVTWDAGGCAGGVYLCRLIAGTFTETRKLLLLR